MRVIFYNLDVFYFSHFRSHFGSSVGSSPATFNQHPKVNILVLGNFSNVETFKNIGSKKITDVGAIQITITKIAPNKAILMSVYPNKEVADKAINAISENLKQVKEIVKVEISEGEVVFNQNSLSHE